MIKSTFYFYALLALFMFLGCSKDSSDMDNIQGVSNRLEDIISKEVLLELKEYMPIYEGKQAPNIEGEYLMDKVTMVYDSYGIFAPGKTGFQDNKLTLSQQKANGSLKYSDAMSSSTSSSISAYIMGSGKNFTVFLNAIRSEKGDAGNVITMNMATIISGTHSATGIHNLRYALI